MCGLSERSLTGICNTVLTGAVCMCTDPLTYADDEDESDADEIEEEAIDRYAPSQAGRPVAGLQHTSSNSRPPPSNDSQGTLDSDDWHRSRSLFNVTWPDNEDGTMQSGKPHRASSTRSTQSQQSFRGGSDKNV